MLNVVFYNLNYTFANNRTVSMKLLPVRKKIACVLSPSKKMSVKDFASNKFSLTDITKIPKLSSRYINFFSNLNRFKNIFHSRSNIIFRSCVPKRTQKYYSSTYHIATWSHMLIFTSKYHCHSIIRIIT